MKKDIHPTTHMAKTTCNSCNAEFTVLSTLDAIEVEVCSQCHPFYTGEQRIMDTAGRADKFAKRMAKAAEIQKSKPAKKTAEVPVNQEEKEETSAQETTETEA